jgi:hypothetical protein
MSEILLLGSKYYFPCQIAGKNGALRNTFELPSNRLSQLPQFGTNELDKGYSNNIRHM